MVDVASEQTQSAYQAIGDAIATKLSDTDITVTNIGNNAKETIKVPVENVTVHAEENGANASLVFQIHLPQETDTAYQKQIGDAAIPIIAALHPDFATTAEGTSPVRHGSYRTDQSVSVVADVPPGKTADEILGQIAENVRNAAPAVATQSAEAPIVAVVDQSTKLDAINTAPVAVASATTGNVEVHCPDVHVTNNIINAPDVAAVAGAESAPEAGAFAAQLGRAPTAPGGQLLAMPPSESNLEDQQGRRAAEPQSRGLGSAA